MKIEIEAIGVITNSRNEVEDDFWGEVESVLEIDMEKYGANSLDGLTEFSHLEVIYYMNRMDPAKIFTGARHPRNNTSLPLVGIFSQRMKNRPNLLGLSRCSVVSVSGNKITVKSLDALNNTPIIDIKPFMQQFAPIGPVYQPEWTNSVMEDYYKQEKLRRHNTNN